MPGLAANSPELTSNTAESVTITTASVTKAAASQLTPNQSSSPFTSVNDAVREREPTDFIFNHLIAEVTHEPACFQILSKIKWGRGVACYRLQATGYRLTGYRLSFAAAFNSIE